MLDVSAGHRPARKYIKKDHLSAHCEELMTSTYWRGRFSACLLFLFAAILFIPSHLHAQQTLGAIAGSVTDSSGSLIPATQVTLTNEQTGFTRTVQSNNGGEYQLLNLAIGTYTLSFTHDGFE